MYILPNASDFNNACASVDRSIATKCEVYVGGSLSATMVGDGINGEIISMEWDNIVCSNDGLQIGTCCMDEFKMTYRPVSTTISLMGKEIHPYVGLDINGTVTYVPLGVFWVTDASTEDDGYTVNITAYDGMQKFMGDFNASVIGVTFPCNAWDLLNAIATYFGVTLTYEDWILDLLSSDDYYLYTSDNYKLVVQSDLNKNKNASFGTPYEGSYREYIGWIAGLVGAFAHMGRNGDLVINQYKDHGFVVGRDVQHMGGAKINYGGSVTYTSIVSGTEGSPIYPTYYGGNAITYTNPYMTQTELDFLCKGLLQVDGITVTPCDVAWRSNPCVDAGDIVGVTDKDGNNLSVYVMERVVRVTGGLAEELHCYGETEVVHTLNKSPLETKLAVASQRAYDTASLINNSSGTMQMIANADGSNAGYIIYDTDGNGLLKCTSGGLGFSADGGLSYTNAITKEGVTASELHVTRRGVDILAVQEYEDGYPELRMRDADGDTILLMRSYKPPVEGADPGAFLRLFDSNHKDLAYFGTTRGSDDTGSIVGAHIALYSLETGNEIFRVYSKNNDSSISIYNPTSSKAIFNAQLKNDTVAGAMSYLAHCTPTGNVVTFDVTSTEQYTWLAQYTPDDSHYRFLSSRAYTDNDNVRHMIFQINNPYANTAMFRVDASSDGTQRFAFDNQYCSWKQVTISGVTYHFFGYTT